VQGARRSLPARLKPPRYIDSTTVLTVELVAVTVARARRLVV